uniref:Sigma54 specific transcriptional regulator, Fis family n=1 Tax=Nitratidesulfovibrio vulgaris (strain DSM 19637 / Miyazaki F) TaxID=883 RepID=B8DLA2_NITV9
MAEGTTQGMAAALGPLLQGLFDQPVAARTLLDRIPLPLALVSAERRVMFLNQAACALTAMSPERAQNLPCRYVFRCSLCTGGCPLDVVDKSPTAAVAPVAREADIVNADRARIPVRVTCGALTAPDGSRVGYFETLEDLRLFRPAEARPEWPQGFGDMLGHSPEMERVFRLLPGIAQTDSSVLVTGETGTGKDLLAEALHNASTRAKGPFVKVNCGALPESLLESELFGHQKGAFTGASENKPGRFRLAHNGTLFLTEVGDLPLPLQVKLLTFLDDKIIHPLGSTRGVHVDVRIMAATHRDLRRMVREGRFREDLLYRLNVVRFHLPPLRERGDDIALFLAHYLKVYAGMFGKRLTGVSPAAERVLLRHAYPGNVRELRNIVEYCVNVCQETHVDLPHLPRYLLEESGEPDAAEGGGVATVGQRVGTGAQAPRGGGVAGADSGAAGAGLSGRSRHPGHPVQGGPPGSSGSLGSPDQGVPFAGVPQGDATWAEAERRLIMEALVQARGRRGEAAMALGWARTTLWRKMRQYGLDQ